MEEKSDYLYAKANRYDDIPTGTWADANIQHRASINNLLEQLRAKGVGREVKELARAIEKWQQSIEGRQDSRGCQPQQDRLYHLRLLDVQKLLQHLDGCFLRVLDDTRQRRLQELYSQYTHILHRIRKLEPTEMHVNSTQMKRHLLEEIKDQQQRRLRAQREKDLLIEGTQEALYQKDKIIRELKANLQQLDEAVGKKDRLIRELRLGHDNTEQNTLQKDRVLRELRSQNDSLRDKLGQLNRQITEKDENMDEYYKTVQTLKKLLEETRHQLSNETKLRECNNCGGDSIIEHSKTTSNGKVLRSNNSYSTSQLHSPSILSKQKMPPIQPKGLGRTGSALEDDGFQFDGRSPQLLRMLLVQAVSIEGLLQNEGN